MLTSITKTDLDESAELRASLLALNNDHAVELSWADEARLMHLIDTAFVAERVGLADVMLIAFDQAADYDSPNFLWFRTRYRHRRARECLRWLSRRHSAHLHRSWPATESRTCASG